MGTGLPGSISFSDTHTLHGSPVWWPSPLSLRWLGTRWPSPLRPLTLTTPGPEVVLSRDIRIQTKVFQISQNWVSEHGPKKKFLESLEESVTERESPFVFGSSSFVITLTHFLDWRRQKTIWEPGRSRSSRRSRNIAVTDRETDLESLCCYWRNLVFPVPIFYDLLLQTPFDYSDGRRCGQGTFNHRSQGGAEKRSCTS